MPEVPAQGGEKSAFDAWNPGLESEIPAHLRSQVTLFRPENAARSYPQACEAAEFCGLRPQDMAVLSVRRLVIHELLIRVTADLWVPDGPNYEDLGLNLRRMATRILTGHIDPHMAKLEQRFAALRKEVEACLARFLDADLFAPAHPPAPPATRGLFARLFGRPPLSAPPRPPEPPWMQALALWRKLREASQDPLEQACLDELARVVGGAVGRRGRLVADRATVLRLTAERVCADHGSRRLGAWIEPLIAAAVQAEGYRRLPVQAEPFIMNVKGASAAGKSTIRPLQKELAERLDLPWEDFALISPDYWRKFLLDYASLGPDHKYAAMLTGQELEIIDRKLDRYMEDKAARAQVTHLLIDRFRFDSFSTPGSAPADSTLLSRFGHTVFLFLIVTPPAETVLRAWERGLTTGRFKAVDDLLFHNVEAYTGMPQLFLSWVNRSGQRIHFEFLDNGVPLGARPRTLAFGWNAELTILDVAGMRAMNLYRHVNVEARRPEDVLLPPRDGGADIIAEVIDKVPRVIFADPASHVVMGRTEAGEIVHEREDFFRRAGLTRLQRSASVRDTRETVDAGRERRFTVGTWV